MTPFLGSIDLLERLTNSGRQFTYCLPVYYRRV